MLGLFGGLGSAGMGLFQGLGKGYNDPSKKAKEMLGQIPGQTEKYYSPYMQAGQGALGDLQNQYKDLLGGDIQSKLGESYKESPGYQGRLKDALTLGQNQSARGGFTGTPMDTEQLMGIQDKLSSEDYNNYLQNQLGLYGLGLSGEQGLNQQGFDASKGMADTLGNVLSQQAGYDYAGKAGKNAYQSGGWENLFKGLGSAGSSMTPSGWEQMMQLFGGGGKGA